MTAKKATQPNGVQSLTPAPAPQGAMIAVAQQREIAEAQASMIVARANPRDEKVAQDRILMACTRPALAEKAMYEYSRGGTSVTGPSIRLAEVLAQNWGNFDFGIRELDQRNGESTVEAYAWDLETNTRQRKVFQVPHVRYTREGGNKTLIDPRDIYEMVANQGARRLRACILGIIPGDVQDEAVKQCEATLLAKAKVTPERLKSLLEGFAAFGVTKEMIETRMQRHLDAMTPGMLIQFGKIYNSLKDGMSTTAEWFKAPPSAATESTGDRLRDALAKKVAPGVVSGSVVVTSTPCEHRNIFQVTVGDVKARCQNCREPMPDAEVNAPCPTCKGTDETKYPCDTCGAGTT